VRRRRERQGEINRHRGPWLGRHAHRGLGNGLQMLKPRQLLLTTLASVMFAAAPAYVGASTITEQERCALRAETIATELADVALGVPHFITDQNPRHDVAIDHIHYNKKQDRCFAYIRIVQESVSHHVFDVFERTRIASINFDKNRPVRCILFPERYGHHNHLPCNSYDDFDAFIAPYMTE
jgi:hypothetical protein